MQSKGCPKTKPAPWRTWCRQVRCGEGITSFLLVPPVLGRPCSQSKLQVNLNVVNWCAIDVFTTKTCIRLYLLLNKYFDACWLNQAPSAGGSDTRSSWQRGEAQCRMACPNIVRWIRAPTRWPCASRPRRPQACPWAPRAWQSGCPLSPAASARNGAGMRCREQRGVSRMAGREASGSTLTFPSLVWQRWGCVLDWRSRRMGGGTKSSYRVPNAARGSRSSGTTPVMGARSSGASAVQPPRGSSGTSTPRPSQPTIDYGGSAARSGSGGGYPGLRWSVVSVKGSCNSHSNGGSDVNARTPHPVRRRKCNSTFSAKPTGQSEARDPSILKGLQGRPVGATPPWSGFAG